MKIRIYILIFLAGVFFSCGEDFLDRTPISNTTADSYYKTADDMTNAVNAVYSKLASSAQYGSNFLQLMEYRSDNIKNNNPGAGGGVLYQCETFTDVPSNSTLSATWSSLYEAVYAANIVIGRIDGVTFKDETLKKRLLGEAYFLRALTYFNLVRLWGKVPLVLREVSVDESKSIKRSAVSEVYTAIESDLNIAIENLPSGYASNSVDLGRASAIAAKALLSKVYLYEKKYTPARILLSEITEASAKDGTPLLLTAVKDVFSASNEMNKEIIFAIRYLKGNSGTDHANWYTSGDSDTDLSVITALYTSADKRKDLMVLQGSGTNKCPSKLYEAPTGNRQGTDFPVLRYADVLLMMAEVLNEESYTADGLAFTYLNAIHTRAGLTAYSSADLADQSAFRQAVWNERRLELALECDRWFDLVRSGQAITAMSTVGYTIQEYQYIYPVPQKQIDIVGSDILDQNDLYN
ncbi:RagB/SusD family nutrient uptake outer membrane protein [Ohtaekwangia koreensis]|uniref:SusD family protein n=1 Tax=Ohtaekwangia koreensis TaxID=688867 RepID=A0A1T5M4Z4_9BACT|nr:RagB/SusD family nutrient uptake outer membrane protein [Ohtaekwangia koreensis]SKC83280.1 SusD family protein [Ohtaekwangia koreensis]